MKELSLEEFKTKLAERIYQLRLDMKLSQEQLAHKIGKDKQFINRYEVKGANPTTYTLLKLSSALGVSVCDLLDFDSKKR